MPRANRHFIAGQVWHITQRCHQQQFLLRFKCDRRRWLYWLYQARRRYGLTVLNYVVTSNHIHLLVHDQGNNAISSAMQLISGRTAQEFNRRQGRKGAFWEDRFHATAVQTNEHLARCMLYIDLNMVRAGEVTHPQHWETGGYYEAKNPCPRIGRLDSASICRLMKFESMRQFSEVRDQWIADCIRTGRLSRQAYWTESVAVGDLEYALKMKRALAYSNPGRRARKEEGCFAVRDAAVPYQLNR